LQPTARIKPVQTPTPPAKPVAKKQLPQNNWRRSAAPAPLQCGGTIEKTLEPYWGNEDSMGHYRQRCGEHNHRQQACFETARRQGVVHY
jgi:hypothetical protein